MGALTQSLAEFIAADNAVAAPARAIEGVRNALTDYAGVTVLGASAPVTRLIASFETIGASGAASVCFSDARCDARAAALINGTAGHADDYDDVGIGFHPAHPSVAMAPALFAQADESGASGRALIDAYVVGYEVWAELASRDENPQHLNGWHPTGVFGAVGAAAATARLMRLDAARAAHALGLAASMASGLTVNFGAMAKPMHAGRAAQTGLMAARYAAAGMTASPDVFDSPTGFLRAVSPNGRIDRTRAPTLGRDWRILSHGVSLKLWPLCYGAHRIMATLPDFVRAHDLRADDVARVVFRTGPSRVAPLVSCDPRTALEAKFSAEFAIAVCFLRRGATLADVTDAFVNQPDTRALMARVSRDIDPARDGAGFTQAPQDALDITLADGRAFTLPLHAPKDQAIAIDAEALWRKFADCVGAAMSEAPARALFETLQRLDDMDDVRALPRWRADAAIAAPAKAMSGTT